ncbi:unnamed protein product, partial [Prorocentrum cordatum]
EKCSHAKVANACLLRKVQLLEDQFCAAELDVIAAQEGRADMSVSKEGTLYTMMCAAACEGGSCGVQIWARHGLTVKTREAPSARFMFAFLSKKGIDFGIVSARARIDFIFVPVELFADAEFCCPDYSPDLTMNAWADHNAVVMATKVWPMPSATRPTPPFRLTKLHLMEPHRVSLFQQLMWLFPRIDGGMHIDDHPELLNTYVRWAGRFVFGDPKRQPRQRWISAQVREFIQH